MKKFNKLALLLTVCIISVALVLVLVACNDTPNGSHTHNNWSDWSVNTVPQENTEGSATRSCAVDGCSETETVKLPALSSDRYTEGADTATCGAAGTKTYTVAIAEGVSIDVLVPSAATGNHSVEPKAAVSATCTQQGAAAYYECSECLKKFSDSEGSNEIDAPASTAIDPDNHNIDEVAAVSATCIKDGNLKHYECADCHKLFSDENGENVVAADSVAIPKEQGSHSISPVDGVPATCKTDGVGAHWACELCLKLYSDANGENETNEAALAISKTTVNHSLTKHNAIAATCISDGNIAYWDCSVCEKYFSDQNGQNEIALDGTVSPMTPDKHRTTMTAADNANCIKTGNIQYWNCKDCHRYFADSACTEETSAEGVIIPIDSTKHMLNSNAQVNANCTVSGHEAYWNCYFCYKLFSDEEATDEIDAPVSIPVDPSAHVLKSVAVSTETKSITNSGGYTLDFKNYAYNKCSACNKLFHPSGSEVTAVLQANSVGTLVDIGYNSAYASRKVGVFIAPQNGKYTFDLSIGWGQLKYIPDSAVDFSKAELVYATASGGWDTTQASYEKFEIEDASDLNHAVINMAKGDAICFFVTATLFEISVENDHKLGYGENPVLIKTNDIMVAHNYTFVAEKEKYSIEIPAGLYVELNGDELIDAVATKKVNFECEIGDEITFSFYGSEKGLYTVTIGEPVESVKLGLNPLTNFIILGDGDVSKGEAMSSVVIADDVTEGRYKLTITVRLMQASMIFGINYDGTPDDFKGTQWSNGEANIYFTAFIANVIHNTNNIVASATPQKLEITLDLKAGDVLTFLTNNNNNLKDITLTLEAVA